MNARYDTASINRHATDEEKFDIVIEHLTGVVDGGYPGECVWVGNTLAYTAARGGGDLKYSGGLGTITREAMLAWYDRAVVWLTENPEERWSSAFYETDVE